MTHRRATAILVRLGQQRCWSVIRASTIVTGSVWCTRYGLFAIPTTLVRRRRARDGKTASEGTESERGQYEIDERVDILSRSVFRTPDTPSFVCATGVRDGRKRLRWARDPLRKILTQAGHKSFLRPRRTCQIAPFIILHLFEIIYDFTL